jgi:hypothetical protein
MINNRLFYLLITLAVVLVITLTIRGTVSFSAAVNIEGAQPNQHTLNVYAARLNALAEYYGRQRAFDAYSARWSALAEYYGRQRELDAYAARLNALAEYYSNQSTSQAMVNYCSSIQSQDITCSPQALAAYAARLNALAAYYLNHNR